MADRRLIGIVLAGAAAAAALLFRPFVPRAADPSPSPSGASVPGASRGMETRARPMGPTADEESGWIWEVAPPAFPEAGRREPTGTGAGRARRDAHGAAKEPARRRGAARSRAARPAERPAAAADAGAVEARTPPGRPDHTARNGDGGRAVRAQADPAAGGADASGDRSAPAGEVSGTPDRSAASAVGAGGAADGSPPPDGASPGEPAAGQPAGGDAETAALRAPDRPPAARPAVLTPPVLLSSPQASPPPPLVVLDRSMLTPKALALAPEGVVVVAVLVHRDGSVGEVRIRTSSGHPALDAAAARAAWGWRFRPATRDGLPTEAWAVVPVRFTAGR